MFLARNRLQVYFCQNISQKQKPLVIGDFHQKQLPRIKFGQKEHSYVMVFGQKELMGNLIFEISECVDYVSNFIRPHCNIVCRLYLITSAI